MGGGGGKSSLPLKIRLGGGGGRGYAMLKIRHAQDTPCSRYAMLKTRHNKF